MKQTLLPILLLISLVGRGQSITTPTALYPRATTDHRQMFVSEDEIDSIWAYLKSPPRTATAWASLQNEVNALERQLSDLVFEVNLNKFMIYGINGMGHKTTTGLVEDNENLKKQVDIITELADSLRRISGYYHDALYGSDLFGKGLLIEEFNDHIEIIFLHRQVDSLIKALRDFQTEDSISDPHFGGIQNTIRDINNVQDLFDPESGLTLKASPYGISRGFAIPPDPDQCFIKVVQEKAFADGIDYGRLYAHIADKHGIPIPGYQPVFKIIGGSAADNLVNVVMTQEGTMGTDAEGNCYVRITSIHPGLVFITVITTKGEDILTKERMADPYVMFR